mgnify:CR=1 FL=1
MQYKFTTLIERIHQCQAEGRMSRPPENHITRFRDVVETHLRPFFADLVSTLGKEGIGTELLLEFDPDTDPTVQRQLELRGNDN